MQLKEEYLDTHFIIKKLKEEFNKEKLNVVRVISSFDDICEGMGYEITFCLITEDKIRELNKIIPSKRKKNIISFNLLQFCEEIINPETEEVVFLPTILMETLKQEIENNALVIFKDSLKTNEVRYYSIKDIPFVKNTIIPNKYKIVKNDIQNDCLKPNLISKDKIINKRLKEFCLRVHENVQEIKNEERNKALEKLKCIRSKIDSNILFTDEECEIFDIMYESYLNTLKRGEVKEFSSYAVTKKRLIKKEK